MRLITATSGRNGLRQTGSQTGSRDAQGTSLECYQAQSQGQASIQILLSPSMRLRRYRHGPCNQLLPGTSMEGVLQQGGHVVRAVPVLACKADADAEAPGQIEVATPQDRAGAVCMEHVRPKVYMLTGNGHRMDFARTSCHLMPT